MRRPLSFAVLVSLAACGGAGASDGAAPSAPDPDDAAASAPSSAGPVKLEELPVWNVPNETPSGAEETQPITLHAADVGFLKLLHLLSHKGRTTLYLSPRDRPVSGRVLSAPSPEAARAAILAGTGYDDPEPPEIAGTGREIDLDFFEARAAPMFRLLSDVLGIDVVLSAPELPRLSLRVRREPADGVLRALAAALDLEVHERGGTWYVVPAGEDGPRAELLALGGPRLHLSARAATASDVLAVAGAVAPVPRAAPCGEGPTFDLRLRNATVGALLAAVDLFAEERLEERAARAAACARPWTRGELPEGARLLVTARRGADGAALIAGEDGARRLLLPGAEPAPVDVEQEPIEVHASYVRIGRGDRAVELTLYPENPPDERPSAAIDELRLAATLVQGGRREALLEGPRGIRPVRAGRQHEDLPYHRVEIEPGRVLLHTEDGPVELRLARRRVSPAR